MRALDTFGGHSSRYPFDKTLTLPPPGVPGERNKASKRSRALGRLAPCTKLRPFRIGSYDAPFSELRWGSFRRARAGIRQQPAVPAAGLFVLGISAYPILPAAPAVWLALIATLLITAIATQKRSMLCSVLIGGAIFTSGLCSAQFSRFNFRAESHRHICR